MTYYRTKITLDVLSEEPIPETQDLGSILEDCDTGPYVLADLDMNTFELTKEEVGKAFVAAGSYETFVGEES